MQIKSFEKQQQQKVFFVFSRCAETVKSVELPLVALLSLEIYLNVLFQ